MPCVVAREPDPITIWIAKWIFLPLIIMVIVGGGLALSLERRACAATCIAAGYDFSDYSQRSPRMAQEATCTCSDHGVLKQVPVK